MYSVNTKTKFSIILFFIIIFSAFFFFSATAIAQTAPTTSSASGIVPCGGSGGSPCTLCHLLKGIQNLVNWGKNILFILTVVGVAIAGLIYMISSGSEAMITTAKNCFKASLVGFSITLAAWLAVNTVIMVLLVPSGNDIGKAAGSWNNITCDTTSSALTGGGGASTSEKKCCVKSKTKGEGDYGKAENCPQATGGSSKADCEKYWNDYYGTDSTKAGELKAKLAECKDAEPTCSEGTLSSGTDCTGEMCGGTGSTGTGCSGVVKSAEQFMAQNCQYCSKKLNDPSGCNLNGCSGNPAYTDCSNLVATTYAAAGCSSPGGQSDDIGSKGEAIGDRSQLKTGDVLWKQGHVAICQVDGCGTVIHASGREDDIKVSGGSYPNGFSKVVRASKYCNSCN